MNRPNKRPHNFLAIDTCFAACSVAASIGDGSGARRATRFEAMTSGHAERLFPMIDEIFAELDAGYDAFDGLAVTVGPGSFTGTRLGIAAVRGLAVATGLKIYGTTSLAAIAARAVRASGWPEHPVLVCHDARRGQIYAQVVGHRTQAGFDEPQVMDVDTLLANLPPGDYSVTGTAAEAVHAAAQVTGVAAGVVTGVADGVVAHRLQALQGDGLPDAEALLDLPLESLAPPMPLYLRPPDAKPQAGQSIARV